MDLVVNTLLLASLGPTIYAIIFFSKQRDEKRDKVINLSFRSAYILVVLGIVIIFIMTKMFDISYSHFRDCILSLLSLVNIFLGLRLYLLNSRLSK
ncbi:hypothetical protein SAMN04487866_10488 [Thermoactinomyces sp. DSM 45891]|nr:hypothetical protein SAMN04487866_10488 [Thermoactinomyces sp. DSM 45891]